MTADLKLLDCTLRDGGYINNWNWGYKKARNIIALLARANVDIIEVGFLRNVDNYDANITVCNHIEELKELLPSEAKNTMFSAMAMRSNYDIKKLSDYSHTGIDLIRITAHDYDIMEGMEFAQSVKEKGYKLSINPINIMGYSDDRILWILEQVNRIAPYQFSIVDTFGSMKKNDLDRIVSLTDHNLDRSIRVGLHLHENMAQSFSLAQTFIDKQLNRPITVDASLMGMGRIPGNLPIELIADYLNERLNKKYDIDYIMDAIQDYIYPIKGDSPWGYTPAYFLSAKYNLHRNYAEYYLKKGDLTNRDINHLLAQIQVDKTTAFDEGYAASLYDKYMDNKIDDSQSIKILSMKLKNKSVLIIAPGMTIKTYSQKIFEYIETNHPVVISVNFIPEHIPVSYAFYSNHKRFEQLENHKEELIVTSNIPHAGNCLRINYNSISGTFDQGCNSLILLLNLLHRIGVENVTLAGADGYNTSESCYYDTSLSSLIKHDASFNQKIGLGLKTLEMQLSFLTPSAYEKYYTLCNV